MVSVCMVQYQSLVVGSGSGVQLTNAKLTSWCLICDKHGFIVIMISVAVNVCNDDVLVMHCGPQCSH